jgi:hypothetical protein
MALGSSINRSKKTRNWRCDVHIFMLAPCVCVHILICFNSDLGYFNVVCNGNDLLYSW